MEKVLYLNVDMVCWTFELSRNCLRPLGYRQAWQKSMPLRYEERLHVETIKPEIAFEFFDTVFSIAKSTV